MMTKFLTWRNNRCPLTGPEPTSDKKPFRLQPTDCFNSKYICSEKNNILDDWQFSTFLLPNAKLKHASFYEFYASNFFKDFISSDAYRFHLMINLFHFRDISWNCNIPFRHDSSHWVCTLKLFYDTKTCKILFL